MYLFQSLRGSISHLITKVDLPKLCCLSAYFSKHNKLTHNWKFSVQYYHCCHKQHFWWLAAVDVPNALKAYFVREWQSLLNFDEVLQQYIWNRLECTREKQACKLLCATLAKNHLQPPKAISFAIFLPKNKKKRKGWLGESDGTWPALLNFWYLLYFYEKYWSTHGH